jgi:uncharacterized membrane protein SpoIIM required for sporulation
MLVFLMNDSVSIFLQIQQWYNFCSQTLLCQAVIFVHKFYQIIILFMNGAMVQFLSMYVATANRLFLNTITDLFENR